MEGNKQRSHIRFHRFIQPATQYSSLIDVLLLSAYRVCDGESELMVKLVMNSYEADINRINTYILQSSE